MNDESQRYKSEIRISKFETNLNHQNLNDQNIKEYFEAPVLNFEHLNFDIVSDFGFRASNFTLIKYDLWFILDLKLELWEKYR